MTAICCDQCFQIIASKDVQAAQLWLSLCAYFVKFEGIFKLRETHVPQAIKHFKHLESLGFITTADGLESVSVRVNGYDIVHTDEEEVCLNAFCLDANRHSDSWENWIKTQWATPKDDPPN